MSTVRQGVNSLSHLHVVDEVQESLKQPMFVLFLYSYRFQNKKKNNRSALIGTCILVDGSWFVAAPNIESVACGRRQQQMKAVSGFTLNEDNEAE